MTRLLLGTNVVSEATKIRPDPAALAWLASQQLDACFLSVLTLGEIQFGISRLAPSVRQSELTRWLHMELIPTFRDRMLPFDRDAALAWGALSALAVSQGKALPIVDSQIAATAKAQGLTLVTRNLRDFSGLGIDLVNPWES
ncbi:MAG TPA: type II toxin-antitoxin system VapC family toxin [Candidatus Acidoferrales bacterium]|nr:type II toxin-antitoxin system VapC family toxin [Candidatus Acidoferrales bacterium]